MGEARGIEPLIAINFVIADNVPHPIGKNFRASAWQRVDARLFHFFERLADRQLRPLRQIRNLDHGEGLHVYLRKTLCQSGNEIKKILEGQIWMQSANNVELGDRLGVTGSGRLEGFFKRHSVSARRIFLAPKSAQPTSCHADIRRIDMAVSVWRTEIWTETVGATGRQPTAGEEVPGPANGGAPDPFHSRNSAHMLL